MGIVTATITDRKDWCTGLMSITVSEAAEFTPGQFFNIGLDLGQGLIRRSYSAASAPGRPLSFLLSRVEQGSLTPRLFDVAVGDSVQVDTSPLGFFTLKEVPETKRLWLLATGTGLGPYLSMLRAGALGTRFERVVLVHGVRSEEQLCYRDEILQHAATSGRLLYVPLVSTASVTRAADHRTTILPGRITNAWDRGELEAVAGPFDADCHMLLCGNPLMVEDMSARLKERGFKKHRRREPGHFNFEKYW